mmetsp:Transcript_31518/g.108979  ORF Transcript_31518/g.108979 Transcript_31518/m.108979 type:complete len:210 (-) Transcript_31518:121-750(-)
MPAVQGRRADGQGRRRDSVYRRLSRPNRVVAPRPWLPAPRQRGHVLWPHGKTLHCKDLPRAHVLPAPQALGRRQDPRKVARARDDADAPAHGGSGARRRPAHGRDGARLPHRARRVQLPARPDVHQFGSILCPHLHLVRPHRARRREEGRLLVHQQGLPARPREDCPRPHPVRLQAPLPGTDDHVHRAAHPGLRPAAAAEWRPDARKSR